MYIGWIAVPNRYESTKHLISLGIKLGRYNRQDRTFENCKVSDESFDKLDKFWGQYVWYLERIDEVAR